MPDTEKACDRIIAARVTLPIYHSPHYKGRPQETFGEDGRDDRD